MSFTLKGIFGNHGQDSSDPSAARAASRKSSITRPGSGADLPGSDSRRVSQSSQIDPSRISAPISSKKVSVTVASSFVAPRSSKGWSPSEWSHWARDGGNSVHRGTRNIILLGIDNFGNSCYVNSVIQALYHCKPFRDAIMDVYTTQAAPPIPAPRVERETGTMYTVLARLFHTMALMATRLSVDPAAGIKRQAPGLRRLLPMCTFYFRVSLLTRRAALLVKQFRIVTKSSLISRSMCQVIHRCHRACATFQKVKC